MGRIVVKNEGIRSDGNSHVCFWNIHEEAEGQYDWKENKDLRRFIELCRKHDLHVWLRIGPWCHGEARYGGFPDWLVSIEGGTRKDNPVYLKYVQRF